MIAELVALFAAGMMVEAPAYSKAWNDAPARCEVDASVRTARVFDADSGKEAPSKTQQRRGKRYVFFTRTDDATAAHRYRIEANPEPAPIPVVFAGGGDMLDYGRADVVTDLGVGLWGAGMPLDWDGDGDWDLLYSCTDRCQGGVYVYLQGPDGVFCQTARIGDGIEGPSLGDLDGDGKLDIIGRTVWCADVRKNGMAQSAPLPFTVPADAPRNFTVRPVDWDGDGVVDILGAAKDVRGVVRDARYDSNGKWLGGTANGYVWFYKNTGSNAAPVYAPPVALEAEDRPIVMNGDPFPCAADWDGDGDMDLICSGPCDDFFYFENLGVGRTPILAAPRPLMTAKGPMRIGLCMMIPVVCDWNRDGKPDLVVGEEDGRIGVFLNQGIVQGAPQFEEEIFLREEGAALKAGGMATPWIDESTRDLFLGDTAGYLTWFRWTGKSFEAGQRLEVDGAPLRIQAGYNGSPQGPNERKWGYTSPSTGDVNGDGKPELVFSNCFGRVTLIAFEAPGRVYSMAPVSVAWNGDPLCPAWNWWKPAPTELIVQWRSRPLLVDYDKDGMCDLLSIDHEGFLAAFKPQGNQFASGIRPFRMEDGSPLSLNDRLLGKSGRANPQVIDWDGDGDLDLIRDSGLNPDKEAGSVVWFENIGDFTFKNRGALLGPILEGHNTAPQAIDWDRDGHLDLLVGAEDGHVYCFHRAMIEEPHRLDVTIVE